MRNKLFKEYINPELGFIKNVCRKYWDTTSTFDDLYNEVLMNIFRYIHTYDPSMPIRPWLYTIIGREMLKLQKKQWQTPIDYVDLGQVPFLHIPIEEDNAVTEDIYTAIESLSPLNYEIISLRMKGYKIKEIASMLYECGKIKMDNVRIIRFRIREAYD